jgi:iron(II)-dependent oxidoreductase
LTLLWRMQLSGLGPALWDKALGDELRARLDSLGMRSRAHAVAAIYQADTGLPILEEVAYSQLAGNSPDSTNRTLLSYLRLAAFSLAILLLLVLGGRFFWPSADGAGDLVVFSSGDYRIAWSDMDGVNPVQPEDRTVYLAEFGIMQHEVTVADYRRCVEGRACRSPLVPSSGLRRDYFQNDAYADYPVVNISWGDAVAFCDWRDMRLPTALEWEVAASYSPITGQHYAYPWGSRFEPHFANYLGTGVGDTLPVGSFHPFGSTAGGLRDMAGNVAEWTSSGGDAGELGMLVKGGSFLDGADQLSVFAVRIVDPEQGHDWLGFRCAR